MSPKLPVISGVQRISAIRKFGYEVVRQKGSHVRLRHSAGPRRTPITIPLHDEIALGTPRRILRDSQVTVEQLIEVL